MIGARRFLLAAAGAAITLALAHPAFAQQARPPQPQAGPVHGDWHTASITENGRKVCYMVSTAERGGAAVRGRAAAYLLVTHRPGSPDEISFIAGYEYPANARVVANVEGRNPANFTLAPEKGNAWIRTEDRVRAIQFMQRGAAVVVRGAVPGGREQTQDKVSLTGFTAAYRAISTDCNVRR